VSNVRHAVDILRAGGLVAFPTETVYGLGADATNADAVAKIFAAKGRPATNPLIVHVAGVDLAKRYTTRWTATAQALAERFWPGPLTLVLPKGEAIAEAVTAGGRTVGLRAPDHPLALELLRAFDGPVAAPSANRSNSVSPTTARHVRDELGDDVDLILDGGPCAVGIESTVLDLSREVPAILRPGGISGEQIERIIGPVEMKHVTVEDTTVAASPGQQAVHYAPRSPGYRVPYREVPRGLSALRGRGRVGLISIHNPDLGVGLYPQQVLPDDPAGYARALYAALRSIDAALASLREPSGETVILIEMPPDLPEWAAVRDRLLRATRPLELSDGSRD
jgi:L-threonylcarbamoyladenylate synthase